jgi:two-component system, chemotaxis family, chemotaxis protein CheY
VKILIVEDDYSSQQLLKRYLQDQGETVIADDGERAVAGFREALASHQPFDLVCLDIMLPSLDGQAVLKQIRSLEESEGIWGLAGCKIIMITALRDADSVMRAFRSQCEGYLSKPISKDKLFREIHSLGLPLKQKP